ncbi:restriction endonuclease [Streptomyces anulatus]
MGEVQQLPELTPRFVEVADHPVLAAAYLAVLLTHAGDAGLDEFQELQAALSDLPVQGGQPGRRVIKTIPERDALRHRRCEYAIRDLMLRDGCTDARQIGGAGDNGADILAADPLGRTWPA